MRDIKRFILNNSLLIPSFLLFYFVVVVISFLQSTLDALPSGDIATDISVGLSRADLHSLFVGNIEARVFAPGGEKLYLPTSTLPLILGIPLKIAIYLNLPHPILYTTLFFLSIVLVILGLSAIILERFVSKNSGISLLLIVFLQDFFNKEHNFLPIIYTYGPDLVAWATLLVIVCMLAHTKDRLAILPILTGLFASDIMMSVSLETLPIGALIFLYFSYSLISRLKLKGIFVIVFLIPAFLGRIFTEGPFFFLNYLKGTNPGMAYYGHKEIFKALYSTFNLDNLPSFFLLLALSWLVLAIFLGNKFSNLPFILIFLLFNGNLVLMLANHTHVKWEGYENYAFWWVGSLFMIAGALLISSSSRYLLLILLISSLLFSALLPKDNLNGYTASAPRDLYSGNLTLPYITQIVDKLKIESTAKKFSFLYLDKDDKTELALTSSLYPSFYIAGKINKISFCSDQNGQMPEYDICLSDRARVGEGVIILSSVSKITKVEQYIKNHKSILAHDQVAISSYKILGYISNYPILLVRYEK